MIIGSHNLVARFHLIGRVTQVTLVAGSTALTIPRSHNMSVLMRFNDS